MIPASDVDPKSGVYQAITHGSTALRIGFFGVTAALLVSVGNAGGVGSTVAGIARVPFVVGIDRYLPPRWKNYPAVEDALRFRSSCGAGVRRGASHQPNQRDHARRRIRFWWTSPS